MIRPPPTSTLFPYTTLFRSSHTKLPKRRCDGQFAHRHHRPGQTASIGDVCFSVSRRRRRWQDRKSRRLNSSHSQISYAVFCLKKKTHPPRKFLNESLVDGDR